MKIRINIALKKSVLDTQGKAIENSLVKNLGYSKISEVRQGKFIDLEIVENDHHQIKEIIEGSISLFKISGCGHVECQLDLSYFGLN